MDAVTRAKLERAKRNREIVDKMERGDPLTSFDTESSFFPPRPTIEKDKDIVKKLYGFDVKIVGDNGEKA